MNWTVNNHWTIYILSYTCIIYNCIFKRRFVLLFNLFLFISWDAWVKAKISGVLTMFI